MLSEEAIENFMEDEGFIKEEVCSQLEVLMHLQLNTVALTNINYCNCL